MTGNQGFRPDTPGVLPENSVQRQVRTSHLQSNQKLNGVAERWIETCRRDLMDRIAFIAVNERHLKRLLFDYVPHAPLAREGNIGREGAKIPSGGFQRNVTLFYKSSGHPFGVVV